jgi:hypothetical protein
MTKKPKKNSQSGLQSIFRNVKAHIIKTGDITQTFIRMFGLINIIIHHPAKQDKHPTQRSKGHKLHLVKLVSSIVVIVFSGIVLPRSIANIEQAGVVVYRNVSGHVLSKGLQSPKPKILLVSIDSNSLAKAGIANARPISPKYLENIVKVLSASKSKVIAINYVLDERNNLELDSLGTGQCEVL